MNRDWKEALRLLCLIGDDALMNEPMENVPTADEFFDTIKMYMGNAPSDWTGLCTSQYTYHEVDGYAWLVWGKYLYIAIPEFDTYERHEDRWARHETLIEAVQMVEHANREDEEDYRQTREDIDNHLRNL